MSFRDINVEKAMKELDEVLERRGLRYTLYTCGGAALIYLGYQGRRTGDVDIIDKVLDPELQEAADIVAKRMRINHEWLNNRVAPLGDRLGKGWKKKCQTIFQGRAVTLKCISRQDLINSKLHAAVDRKAKDYSDLIWLSPTAKEIELARQYAIRQGTTETYHFFVDAYVQELKVDLGIR